MKLVIVESPGKIAKIKEFLGNGFEVMASIGHIRDIAEGGKGDDIGIDLTTFEARYEVSDKKRGQAKKLKKAAESASEIYLCSDADREGEAIAWHLKELLGRKYRYRRAKYTEVTQRAVETALANSGDIDMALVEAQQTRRIIDRIIGYQASPVLWKALGKGHATGRVQAAALSILYQRQREIAQFKSRPYWSVTCTYPEGFKASFVHQKGVASEHEAEADEADDIADREEEQARGSKIFDPQQADAIALAASSSPHRVVSIEQREGEAKPKPPLTTSSMQQIASVALGMSTEEVMESAQRLFESGDITYHRTDSPAVDAEFQKETLTWLRGLEAAVSQKEGREVRLCPEKPRIYKQKANAQGAHECIRPTHLKRRPAQGKGPDENLYALIYYFYLASQAASARDFQTKVTTEAGPHHFVASGRRQLQPGFRWLLQRISSRVGVPDREIPGLQEGQQLGAPAVDKKKGDTTPPPLMREADLVKKMEKEGVGRPSTYQNTIKALLKREYIEVNKAKRLKVTDHGESAILFLEKHMRELPYVPYTAEIERQLDRVASGEVSRKEVLSRWYRIWNNTVQKAKTSLGLSGADESSGGGRPQRPGPTTMEAQVLEARAKLPTHFD